MRQSLTVLMVCLLSCEVLVLSCWNVCRSGSCFSSNETVASSLVEAQLQCRKSGKKLLELENGNIGTLFVSELKRLIFQEGDSKLTQVPIWLNLKTKSFKPEWRWDGGSPYKGEIGAISPDVHGSPYVAIQYTPDFKSAILETANSREHFAFICSEEGCSKPSCLSYHTEVLVTWFDARYECHRLGKKLAVLNWFQNSFTNLPELIQHTGVRFWLGLTRQNYYWQDSGQLMNYHSWSEEEPRLEHQCAVLTALDRSYKWMSVSCNSFEFLVVCMSNK